jgi:hypothetical protein
MRTKRSERRGELPARGYRVFFRFVLVAAVAVLASGCWSVRPKEHIEFHRAVGIGRDDLRAGIPLSMEIDRDRLVATAPLETGEIALYYVNAPTVRRGELSAANDVTRIDVVAADGVAPRRLERGSGEYARTLAAFPVLQAYSERHWGFDDPDEEDGPVHHLPGGGLRWDVSFSLPGPAGSGRITFQALGTEERGTRSIFLFVTPPDGERHRYSLNRSTYDVTRRMTARTQRLFRSVAWDGRYLLLYDRLIDTKSGQETELVDRAPTTFVDHMVFRDGDIAAVVYGSRRISKEIVISSDES